MSDSHPVSRKFYSPLSLPLWGRIWRDYWYILALCGGTLFAFHWLVVTFVPRYDMRYRLVYIRQLPDVVKAMIGPDVMMMITSTSITAFSYIHPISLIVLISFSVMMPSWILVGQIDRGTIELLLATPTSRRKILFTTIFASVVGGLLLVGAMLLGTWIGIQQTELSEPIAFDRIVLVAANLYALYFMMAGASVFFSSITSMRGWAVGWTVAIGVGSYLIHFLAEWWELVQKIAFLGPLYYFRPVLIADGAYDPTRDIVILLAAGSVFLVLSTIWFSRRDIAVV